jgi:hypothetical protein
MKSELGRLLRTDSSGEMVIGTYLYPYRLFSNPDWEDPYSATEIVAGAKVASRQVLITRNGGLFLHPPEHFSDPLADTDNVPAYEDIQAKRAFEEEAAIIFNRLICEFTLKGIVSEPAAPVHIARGELIDGHALIRSCGGGREIYFERTIGPLRELLHGDWRTHRVHGLKVLEQVLSQECTLQLVQVSDHLPALIAGAYSLFSRGQLSEALIDSWIVIEQILDDLWTTYLAGMAKDRKRRLSDTRTYTAAVRTEVLHTTGAISDPLYESLNTARKHRNDLAHRAEINLGMAVEVIGAMKEMIEFLTGISVASPAVSRGINW